MTRVSGGSSFGTIVVVFCIAAAGMFEFEFVRGHWPDAATGFAARQMLAGVVLLSTGGLLCSPPPCDTSPPRPAPHVVAGKWALVAGTALIVSAVAGLLHLATTN